MYSTVLVATDGSDPAAAAALHAIDLSATYDAKLYALFVVDQTYPAMAEFDAVVERQEAEGESALDSIRAEADDRGVDIELVLRRGKPYEEVLRFATHNDVDLVFVGATGRTGMERLVNAGSTTQRLVRRAHVPIVAVPPSGREPIA